MLLIVNEMKKRGHGAIVMGWSRSLILDEQESEYGRAWTCWKICVCECSGAWLRFVFLVYVRVLDDFVLVALNFIDEYDTEMRSILSLCYCHVYALSVIFEIKGQLKSMTYIRKRILLFFV
jgi:hypothetical protein